MSHHEVDSAAAPSPPSRSGAGTLARCCLLLRAKSRDPRHNCDLKLHCRQYQRLLSVANNNEYAREFLLFAGAMAGLGGAARREQEGPTRLDRASRPGEVWLSACRSMIGVACSDPLRRPTFRYEDFQYHLRATESHLPKPLVMSAVMGNGGKISKVAPCRFFSFAFGVDGLLLGKWRSYAAISRHISIQDSLARRLFACF